MDTNPNKGKPEEWNHSSPDEFVEWVVLLGRAVGSLMRKLGILSLGSTHLIREVYGLSCQLSISFLFWDLPFLHCVPPWGLASPDSCIPLAQGLVFVSQWKTRRWEYKLWPVNREWLELIGYGSIPWKKLPIRSCHLPAELPRGRYYSLIYLFPLSTTAK